MNDLKVTRRHLRERPSLDQFGRQGSRGAQPLLRVLLAALAFSLPLSAASTLEEKSPFLPAGHNSKKAVPKPPPVKTKGPLAREIEFRGSVEINGAYQVSLFNKAEQKSYWIKVGEEKEGIKVTAFDPESMAVTLNQNGRSDRLSLKESTDSPMPVAVSAPPAPSRAQPKLPQALQNATNTNNSSKKKTIPRRRVILPKK
ncbi:MAG: hypothetical protein ACSHYA_06580 [Opitutaceae bacterium]